MFIAYCFILLCSLKLFKSMCNTNHCIHHLLLLTEMYVIISEQEVTVVIDRSQV